MPHPTLLLLPLLLLVPGALSRTRSRLKEDDLGGTSLGVYPERGTQRDGVYITGSDSSISLHNEKINEQAMVKDSPASLPSLRGPRTKNNRLVGALPNEDPITSLSSLQPISVRQTGVKNVLSSVRTSLGDNTGSSQHCPPHGPCRKISVHPDISDSKILQVLSSINPAVLDADRLRASHSKRVQSREGLNSLPASHNTASQRFYDQRKREGDIASQKDAALPSPVKFSAGLILKGSANDPIITHRVASGNDNPHIPTHSDHDDTHKQDMERLEPLLPGAGNGARDEIEGEARGAGGEDDQSLFTNQEIPHGREAPRGATWGSLMDVLKLHNSDQLRHLLGKEAQPRPLLQESPAESSLIIRSTPPYLTRAKPATRADWVSAARSMGPQNTPIDLLHESKTPTNAFSKSRVQKRDVRQQGTRATHRQGSLDSKGPYSLQTNTSAGISVEDLEWKEGNAIENSSLADTKLSYRFRGMVGLVDDSRLPIKHFDNSEGLGRNKGRAEPQSLPQLPSTNDTNENNAVTTHKTGNSSSVNALLITEPINATKPAGHPETPKTKTTPQPSFSPSTDNGDQGPIKATSQAESSPAEPETEPEAESEFDIDISIDPGSEPETESEPEVQPENNPDMEPETEITEPSYPEGESEDNGDGEYMEHVDAEPGDSEPEPEIEPTAEPEGGDKEDPCISECYAEPAPEWELAKGTWKAAWEIHVYGLGTVFAVLALYSMVSIIRLSQQRNLLSQGYFISLNAMLLLLCTCRAATLMIDGYNSGGTFHPVAAYVLYSLGMPALTSAFSILFLALLKTMKMQLLSPRIQRPQVLLGIILIHFTISVTIDMIVGYFYDGRVTAMVCQGISLLWGALLSVGYMYVFRQLFISAIRRQKELLRMNASTSNLGTQNTEHKQPKLMVSIAIKVTLVTAILGAVLVVIHIYGMVDVTNVFTNEIPQPWPWWGLHFGLRLTEICMCITMSYVATQPFRYPKASPDKTSSAFSSKCWDAVYLVPCCRLCQCGDREETQDFSHQLQMTAHQESLVQNHQSMGYSNANLNQDLEENAYEITETPALDDRKHIIDNKLFGAVPYPEVPEESEVPETTCNKNRRPRSMLIKEDGFIRFRQDWDPIGDPIGSTDDELNGSSSIILDNGYISTSNGDCVRSSGDPGHYHRHFAKYYQAHKNGRQPQCDKEGNVASSEPYHSISVPNTGANTPATPRSFCSTDAEVGVFTFRPPSSIHLRESIEGALDYSDLSLRSPDYFGTQDSFTLPKTPEELEEKPRKRKYSEADIPFGTRLKRGSSRASRRSCQSDLKSPDLPWVHRSPKQYWEKVKSKGSSVSLNLATPYSSGYSPLGDGEEQFTVAEVRNYLMRSSLYRSNSDSLTHIKYDNYQHGTDV